jgi:hypothetical protein
VLGKTVFQMNLPMDLIVGDPRMIEFAMASLINQMLEKGKSVKRLSRVERGRQWILWIETD